MFNFFRRLFFPAYGPKPGKHPWQAIAFHGRGTIHSPFDMTESEACIWVANVVKGEIAYIDREAGFIFYRSKS